MGSGASAATYANNYILVYPKDLKLLPTKVETKVEGYNIEVTSDRYARSVFLSLDGDPDHHFSDNYFDLLPGEEHTVSEATTMPAADVQRHLHVMVYR